MSETKIFNSRKKISYNNFILQKFLSKIIFAKYSELQVYLVCIKDLIYNYNEEISMTNLELLKESLTFFFYEKISDCYYHERYFLIPSLFYSILQKLNLQIHEHIITLNNNECFENLNEFYLYFLKLKNVIINSGKDDKIYKFTRIFKDSDAYIKEFLSEISEY